MMWLTLPLVAVVAWTVGGVALWRWWLGFLARWDAAHQPKHAPCAANHERRTA